MSISVDESKYYVIQTKEGPVRGYIERIDGRTYYKFKSIPYAKPPVGDLRFRPPSPIEPWVEELDCTKEAPLPYCFILENEGDIVGSEDALYIEVSTPDINPNQYFPVMVWLGCLGYSFLLDSNLDPKFLNDQNVVFVRCGFRIGPFGFLSTNEFTTPGNVGLKDIIMVLKWIKRNIKSFGGDSDNVTLFGFGTGGAIIHLMMMSSMATGLFHKAIIQSTSALNSWSLSRNPSQAVLHLAEIIGIKKKCKMEIVEELKCLPAITIMESYKIILNTQTQESPENFDFPFIPCIEEEFEGQPAFITKQPALILKSGNYNKVPLIIGSNNIEGAVIEYIKKNVSQELVKYNEDASLLVPKFLIGDAKLADQVGRRLLKFYLGDTSLGEDTKNAYFQMITDYNFLYYIQKTISLHIEAAPESSIFYYVINYAGEWSVPQYLKFMNTLGHCSELPFMFGIKTADTQLCKGSRDSVTTRTRIVKMWTNFAKYGNPTPDEDDPQLQVKWDPVENKDKLNYLSIGTELTKGRNPFRERMALWEELHKEHVFCRVVIRFQDMGINF